MLSREWRPLRPDGTNRQSPKAATQPREYLITGYQLNFPALDLAQPALNLEPPSLLYVGIRRTVERLN
jgi:hypothetical protein